MECAIHAKLSPEIGPSPIRQLCLLSGFLLGGQKLLLPLFCQFAFCDILYHQQTI